MLVTALVLCVPSLALAQANSDSTQTAAQSEAVSQTRAAPDEEATEPYRPPDAVAARSLVIPGWGQQVNGQSGKGWFLTTLAVVGVLLGTETIQLNLLTGGRTQNNLERDLGWFMYGGAVVWATIDGYTVAKKLNRENGYDLAHWPGPAPNTGPQVTLLRLGF